MNNSLGENLNILILTEPTQDWLAFSSWYSITKTMPAAKIAVVCVRNLEVGFQYFQWMKRLKVPHRFINPADKPQETILNSLLLANTEALIEDGRDTLVITSHVMAVHELESLPKETCWAGTNCLWVPRATAEVVKNLVDDYMLTSLDLSEIHFVQEAKDTTFPCTFVSIHKGVGTWIDTKKGCPFSSAASVMAEDITVNELRIVELWRKMVSLYNAVQ
jgi:hypothetical protein